MTQHTTDFQPAEIPTGRRSVGGTEEIQDAKGRWIPVSLAKTSDLLVDEQVRKIMGFAIALSDQVTRFKLHTLDDIEALVGLLAQDYGVTMGGKKGNMTFHSHDGCFKVQVQVQDNIEYGSELQIAKQLIDQCLNEWAETSRPEIRTIVTRAFNTDKAGKVNRAELYMLTRLEIDDERWVRAMKAIKDAERVIGSKEYVRFYMRPDPEAEFTAVTIDLAKA